ncbi:MAG TPA: M23 family metallopeptidase [Tenuifilaceae bacterium]|nr:M23 family metallopeptidase [Tenuifilaceae bacterium]HPE17268.1 M23 family metallopeptidase [Tenuifilaceae bacterium]HPJ44494.1 M23 family metallopeptidase [Tenuifilaceae bacterium]HPQ33032.1 M23 family metallopeptidase [Tenuifilaceae bacterium]HRX67724.1 M23 family metallopeptidase [Tenuifilaceae bacterium]
MANKKYRYNPQTLSFDHVDIPLRKKLANLAIRFILSIIFAAIFGFGYSYFFDTPKEKILKRENEELAVKFDLFEKRILEAEKTINDIQNRDNQIYRSIFEADTIPTSLRQGGFGGANHYQRFEGMRRSDLLIRTATLLDLLTWKVYIQSKSFDEIIHLAKNKEQMIQSVPAIQPISIGDLVRISDYFGYRSDPFTKKRKAHHGIDFAGPLGTPIYATGKGTVTEAAFSFFGYGNVVMVDHDFGYKTRYAHLDKILVTSGQKISRGQIIGYLGNSGRSTGPHLHYEVLLRNNPVDPLNYFNDMSEEEYNLMVKNATLQVMD